MKMNKGAARFIEGGDLDGCAHQAGACRVPSLISIDIAVPSGTISATDNSAIVKPGIDQHQIGIRLAEAMLPQCKSSGWTF